MGQQATVLTEKYLSKKFPLKIEDVNLLINASVLPDDNLIGEISSLKEGETLVKGETVIASVTREVSLKKVGAQKKRRKYGREILQVMNLWDIFQLNDRAITADFAALAKKKKSQPPDETNRVLGKDVFIEQGAKVSCAVLNSTTGPIYIGKDAEVMEGSLLRGPIALCENSVLKMGSKIYGATTIGP